MSPLLLLLLHIIDAIFYGFVGIIGWWAIRPDSPKEWLWRVLLTFWLCVFVRMALLSAISIYVDW